MSSATRGIAMRFVAVLESDDAARRDDLIAAVMRALPTHAEVKAAIAAFTDDPADGFTRGILVDELEAALDADDTAAATIAAALPHRVTEAADGLESVQVGSGGSGTEPATSRAYPLLRPAVAQPGVEFVLQPEVPFDLQVGLSKTPPTGRSTLATPGGIGEVGPGTTVHVHLAYDPASFAIDQVFPLTLSVTAEDGFPTITFPVTPLATTTPLSNRRIAAHYLVDGRLRGLAFLTLRDADADPLPAPPAAALLDLTPLAGENAPDVLVAVYRADAASAGSFTMAAFPRDADVAPPQVGRVDLGEEAAEFMGLLFKEANRGGDPTGVYDNIAGIGWRIGNEIPDPIFDTLRVIAERDGRASAATMLLLTEESAVPWELAAVGATRDITSLAGGDSPFLGAHFAIGRWPISASSSAAKFPDQTPLDVHRAALVRADYTGVGDGWRPLPGAAAEVAELSQSYAPAEEWDPIVDEIKEHLFSDVDVIHFALHGRVDEAPSESGLVLLRKDGDTVRPAYLGSAAILGLLTRDPPPFPHRPFVFLNACQVGQGEELLGDYAGLAAALLEAGARAVVACLWNVVDEVAGSISTEFYRRADAGETPAEILRSVRTRYTRPVADALPPADASAASVPTLIAYQYFGHPGLRVARTG